MTDRVTLWVLRLLWISLPYSAGALFVDALDGRSSGFGSTAAVGLWTGWAIGLVALLVPHTTSLTFVRIVAPASLAAAMWAVTADSELATELIAACGDRRHLGHRDERTGWRHLRERHGLRRRTSTAAASSGAAAARPDPSDVGGCGRRSGHRTAAVGRPALGRRHDHHHGRRTACRRRRSRPARLGSAVARVRAGRDGGPRLLVAGRSPALPPGRHRPLRAGAGRHRSRRPHPDGAGPGARAGVRASRDDRAAARNAVTRSTRANLLPRRS